MVCTVQDLNKENQTHTPMPSSEIRFRELLETMPSIAVQSYALDGTILYWNRASESLYGYSASEAVGQNMFDLIIPDEIQALINEEHRAMFQTGQPAPAGEFSLKHKNGSRVTVFTSHAYVAAPGQLPELFCIDIDLTKLRRLEEALRWRKNYQQALLDNFPFMVWIKDEQGRFLAVNKAFASTFKWPSTDSLIGKNDFSITTPEWANKYRADDLDVMNSGTLKITEEMTGSSEPRRWVETFKSPIMINGQVTGTVGFARKITERKQHEADLIAAKAEAESANRSKTQFLAAASHDLRQPVAALLLYLAILKNTVSPDCMTLLDNIQNCVDSMNELLTDLLDVSKLEAGVVVPKMSDIPINDLLHSLAAVHDARAEAKGLRLQVRHSSIVARSDMQILRRILGNLIINAVRYTQRGGVLVACRQHQSKHWIEVWDTGIGIPEEKTAFIFEEFTQLAEDGIKTGTGLGLAIVAQAAKLLNLQIRMHSRPGRGSMFAIELPVSDVALPPKIESRPIQSVQRLRVALIEDNPMVLRSLTLTLQFVGHQVIAASDGKTVIEKLEGKAPDVVISDYRLEPPETGFDVIESLRNIFGSNLPAMIITGDTNPELIRSMAGRGIAVHYKPLPIESLQRYIAEAIQQSGNTVRVGQ